MQIVPQSSNSVAKGKALPCSALRKCSPTDGEHCHTHICVSPTKFCSQEWCVHVGLRVCCSACRELLHKDTQDKWETFLKHENCPEKCIFYRYMQIPMVTRCPWRAFQHSGLCCSNKHYKCSGASKCSNSFLWVPSLSSFVGHIYHITNNYHSP